jgi:hypothetical protein
MAESLEGKRRRVRDVEDLATSGPGKVAMQRAAKAAADAGEEPLSEEELLAIHQEGDRKAVFGHNYKTDRNGNPIPQGIGSWPHHVTMNSLFAIRRYEGEQRFQAACRRLWKECPERARKIGCPEPERISA